MKVYISGKITGTTDYIERFQAAADRLKNDGYDVVNPAEINSHLPEGTTYEQYMEESIKLLQTCDCIYMLRGWEESKGAKREYHYAVEHNYIIRKEKIKAGDIVLIKAIVTQDPDGDLIRCESLMTKEIIWCTERELEEGGRETG